MKIYLLLSFLGIFNTVSAQQKSNTPGAVTDTAKKPMPSLVLKEVVVKSQKIIEQTDDKIIYNVENDPKAKGQSLIDLLRQVPFLSVNGEDKVLLNGQSNFKVLLNGRETAMFAQNMQEALQGFPSAAITKIEVITNPSAKYDAEGIGGIINIITKKKLQGYNGSVSTWSTTINQHIVNTNLNARLGKIGIVFNYGTRSNIRLRSSSTSTTIPSTAAIYKSRLLTGDRTATFFSQFGNGEINWNIDSLNILSIYDNISGGSSKLLYDLETATTFNDNSSSNTDFISSDKKYFPTNTIGADFIRKFAGKPEQEFSIRVNAEHGLSNSFIESIENNSVNTRYNINNSNAKNDQYTFQTDLIKPISNKAKLEIGARATLRRASSDFQSKIKYDGTEEYKLNPLNTDNFRFFQDVYSAYASYSFKVKLYSFRIGLRIENTAIRGSFGSAKAFANNSYINLLPNFQVSTRIKNIGLVLSYNQRLQRPYISYLNPFVDNSDTLNISYGNPHLDAQTVHVVSLQSRLQKGKTFVGLSFGCSYSNNMIVNTISFNPGNGVRTTTYENIGRDLVFSLNGSINTKLGEKWSGYAGINFSYRTVKNKTNSNQGNGGIAGNNSIGVNYLHNSRLSMNSYVGFEKSGVALQSHSNAIPFCGTGAIYQVVQNKLRIGITAQNYFAKYFDYITYIKGASFETVNRNRNRMAKLVLTANWNFGKLKEQVSKKKGITNEDLIGTLQ